jgi:hypothetical protein
MNLTFYKNKFFVLILFSGIVTLILYIVSFYSLAGPNLNSTLLSPKEAYKIVLHNFYNYSSNKIDSISMNDVKDKFTYQSVMIKSNGTVYQVNPKDHSIIKTIDNITNQTIDGIHFAWEIIINHTKFYVDSTSGQIISTSKIKVK